MSDEQAVYPCPECGAATDWRLECPGYGKDPIMVCLCCGNAIEFYCTNKECAWWHRVPNNRSDAATMGAAPAWLDQALAAFSEEDDDEQGTTIIS